MPGNENSSSWLEVDSRALAAPRQLPHSAPAHRQLQPHSHPVPLQASKVLRNRPSSQAWRTNTQRGSSWRNTNHQHSSSPVQHRSGALAKRAITSRSAQLCHGGACLARRSALGRDSPLSPYLGAAFMLPRLLSSKGSGMAPPGLTQAPEPAPCGALHLPALPATTWPQLPALPWSRCRSARVLPPALSNTTGDGRELEMPGKAFLISRSQII